MIEELNLSVSLDAPATGNRIRELIEKRGFTAVKVSEILGFTRAQAIYKWYNGSSMPSLDNLVLLSRILEVPIDDIIVVRSL